jgi:choline dehydrogenase
MVYIRGAREDYESWEAAGNVGWGWDDVLRCYRAMEDTEAGANEFRGAGGPLHVRCGPVDFHPLYIKFVLASSMAGLALNEDFNGATQEGVGAYQYTRIRPPSVGGGLLRPAEAQNVSVVTHASNQVLFEGTRATGSSICIRVMKTALAGRESFWLVAP